MLIPILIGVSVFGVLTTIVVLRHKKIERRNKGVKGGEFTLNYDGSLQNAQTISSMKDKLTDSGIVRSPQEKPVQQERKPKYSWEVHEEQEVVLVDLDEEDENKSSRGKELAKALQNLSPEMQAVMFADLFKSPISDD